MDDQDLPATQSVLPFLLEDVVAYVEVRSGHDNRSRGVICELKSLGARIATTLSKDVTHVVFQGGHVSTYRKARKMCNVVAVSWIEASKELGCKAPEEEHPPPGFEKYEDPDAARRIKVLKSMQPDFDDEKNNERLNAILEKIKKKNAKRSASTADEMCSTTYKPGRKRKSTICNKKSNESNLTKQSVSLTSFSGENETKTERSKRRMTSSGSELTNPPENSIPLKRKGSVKKVKLFSHRADIAPVTSSETMAVENKDLNFRTTDQKQSKNDDKRMNENNLVAQSNLKSNISTPQKPIEFLIPKPVRHQKSPKTSPAGQRETVVSISVSHLLVNSEERSKTEPKVPSENSVLRDKNKALSPAVSSCVKGGQVQTRPLVFIENIQREKDHTANNNKGVDVPSQLVIAMRQTRRSSGLGKPLMQVQGNSGSTECQSDISATNPFVAKVLETLSKKKKRPKVILKSPWRRQVRAAAERRQSPRLIALHKENQPASNSAESEESDGRSPRSSADSMQKKTAEVRMKACLPASASAHMFHRWKKMPRKINSPDTALLNISYGPSVISQISDQKGRDTDSDASSVCSHPGTLVKRNVVERGVGEDSTTFKPLPETMLCELTEGDRSASPVLGTRMKHRPVKFVLSSSCMSTQTIPGVAPLRATSSGRVVTDTQGVNCTVVATTAQISKESKQLGTKKENGQDIRLNCTSSSSAEIDFGTEEGSRTDGLDTSTRPTRKRNGSGRVEKLPTLVCTYLNRSDVKRVIKAVRNLGKFEFEEHVSERTTHLVASGPRRTINMLRAICRGCWILRDEWVYKSVKAQKWLPEEDFELTEFSPMVQQRRLLRQSQGGLSQWNLLSSVGPIFVSHASQPTPPDIKDLIHLSGGSVAKSVEKAAVVMGPPSKLWLKRKNGKPHVEPAWLLDCIVKGEKLPFSSPKCQSEP